MVSNLIPKFDAEFDFEVHLAVAPPKSTKDNEKLISTNKRIFEKNIFTNRKLQIVGNARCRSFAPIGAVRRANGRSKFRGQMTT